MAKRTSLQVAALFLLLAACDSRVDPDDEPARLLEAAFSYDVTANPGFITKSATWIGDTLTLHDLWALTDQPVLRGIGEGQGEELTLRYEATSDFANDWMPSVETRLRILVPAHLAEVKIRWLPMPKARKPSASEASLGVQDATGERVLALRRP